MPFAPAVLRRLTTLSVAPQQPADAGRSPGFVRRSIPYTLAIVLSLIFHDMMYGPQAALIAESFGTNLRFSGAGIGYQLASVIAGGPAPLIAAAILEKTGSSTGISWYIIGCCVVSAIALVLMPRTQLDREAAQEAETAGAPA